MTVWICAICGKDTFFLYCNGEASTLACTGCGTKTEVRVSECDRGNLVDAP
jgi:DNA-directed RNA polymerase subunit RPC12/RpoP